MIWDSGAYQFATSPPGTVDLEAFGVGTGAGACNVTVIGSSFPLQGVIINDVDIGTLGVKVRFGSVTGFDGPPDTDFVEQLGDEDIVSVVLERRVRAREPRVGVYTTGEPAIIQARIQQLHALLLEESPVRLTLDKAPDRQLFCELRSMPMDATGAYFVSTMWQGDLEFYANDPWFHDILQSQQLGITFPAVALPLGDGPVWPDLVIVGPSTSSGPEIRLWDWQDTLVGNITFAGLTLAAGQFIAIRCKPGQQSMYQNSTGNFGEGTPIHSARTDGTFLKIKREYSRFRTGEFAKLSCANMTGAGELRAYWHNSWST